MQLLLRPSNCIAIVVMDNIKSQNWVALLYPEDETHAKAMEQLKVGKHRFAAILHDKDSDENGELKKPHWHIVFCFKYQRFASAIAKEFGIEPNYIQPTKARDKALRYLIHADDCDKYQYDASEVFGPLASFIPQDSVKLPEREQVMALLDILHAMPVPSTYTQFLIAACNADLYSAFRRMGMGAIKLLEEHNARDATFDPGLCSYETSRRRANFAAFVEGYEAGHKDSKKGELNDH